MAVGKGSMERAAKAAEKKAEVQAEVNAETKVETKTEPKTETKMKTQKKASVKKGKVTPKKEVMDQIVYQQCDGVLNRDALPNETFGLGDAMPVYYF